MGICLNLYFLVFQHDPKNEKINDPKYRQKRIANTISVQLHRQRKPKVKFEDLQEDTKASYKEALKFENFLKDELDLRVTGIDEKLKDHDERYKEFTE